jgi:hypothetical protein
MDVGGGAAPSASAGGAAADALGGDDDDDDLRQAMLLSIQLAKSESTCYCPCIIGKADSGACSLAGMIVLGKYP